MAPSTPLNSDRTPFAALPISRFYPADAFPATKKPFTPGSLKRRLSPAGFASPCKKRATDESRPCTPGEFAVPRPPKVVSKCLFEDVEMDADDSGFAASTAMKMPYGSSPSSSNASKDSYLAPALIMDKFAHSPAASPKTHKPDASVLAPSPEILSNPCRNSSASASRWMAGKARDPDAHHPGFDVYCDPIGYDASLTSSPMAWEEDPTLPELVFDSPKENDAPPRKAKRMPPPLSLMKDALASSPLSSTPKRPSRLATSTSIESPWARMQLGESTNGANSSDF
ncbi:Vacuole protein [Ceratobasidium theobromae]|uniref:Vacuole protein n=1 Tax=Ceratobasidium theobromae TaxID=1582974 RepID=A0A5N5QSX4_9AGAM|nr:Vacuole protein [Ceratobasidium theobromae]